MLQPENFSTWRLLSVLFAAIVLSVLNLLPPGHGLAFVCYGLVLLLGVVVPLGLDRCMPLPSSLWQYHGETVLRTVLLGSLLLVAAPRGAMGIALLALIINVAAPPLHMESKRNCHPTHYKRFIRVSIVAVLLFGILTLITISLPPAVSGAITKYAPFPTIICVVLLAQVLSMRYLLWTGFYCSHPMSVGQSRTVWMRLSKQESPNSFWKWAKLYERRFPDSLAQMESKFVPILPVDTLLAYFDDPSWECPVGSCTLSPLSQSVIASISARDGSAPLLWEMSESYRSAVDQIRELRKSPAATKEVYELPALD